MDHTTKGIYFPVFRTGFEGGDAAADAAAAAAAAGGTGLTQADIDSAVENAVGGLKTTNAAQKSPILRKRWMP